MIRGFFRLAVAAALICAIGGHWALLQSIAWTGMIINFSQNSTWKEAIKKTFDGKHPCQLCKAVAEGKKSERRQQWDNPDTKLDFFCWAKDVLLDNRLSFEVPGFSPPFIPAPFETPPIPPPRF